MERVMPILSLKSISIIKRFRTVLLFLYSLFFEAVLQINMNRAKPPILSAFCLQNVSQNVMWAFFSVSMIATAKFSCFLPL